MLSVLATVTIFKKTLVPVVNYLKCFGYGTRQEHSSEIRRFSTNAQQYLEETVSVEGASGQEISQQNCQKITESTSFVKNSFKPVQFYPEQSMHRPACPYFTKTRLYSLPATKSLENPVTCDSPWTHILGSCRWYSQKVEEQ